ncbi:hypothetical protein A2191_03095 [Candidatus Woesebacteria bacterium RIFOXYA1_FULL_38_9]|nr:MAG: hypothetical protein A2191_03095 [Candidatus Woesebacteria bacterium RIFOXYA1_FULL_38_9]
MNQQEAQAYAQSLDSQQIADYLSDPSRSQLTWKAWTQQAETNLVDSAVLSRFHKLLEIEFEPTEYAQEAKLWEIADEMYRLFVEGILA